MLGGLSRVNKDEIKVSFNTPTEQKKKEYKDSFPDDLPTMGEVKQEHGVIVWCQYTKCKHNASVEGLQRLTGTILKNRSYTPINEQEHIWSNICTRDEIAIKFDTVSTASGAKTKVPSCFTAATGTSGHMDFSSLLQGDGSPLGGNIDSQSTLNSGY